MVACRGRMGTQSLLNQAFEFTARLHGILFTTKKKVYKGILNFCGRKSC